jgi:hypothetical protein
MHRLTVQAGRTTALQATLFGVLLVVSGILFFHLLALPVLEAIFRDSLGARIDFVNRWYEWRLVVDLNSGGIYNRDIEAKVYLFNPMLALAPVTVAMGFVVASIVSALLPPSVGLLRKTWNEKLHRHSISLRKTYMALLPSRWQKKLRFEFAKQQQFSFTT